MCVRKLVVVFSLAALGLVPGRAFAFHPPNGNPYCNCYYPVWVVKGQESKSENAGAEFTPDSKSNSGAGGGDQSGKAADGGDDKTCSGDAAKKRELIDLEIKKVKLEIQRLEGAESGESEESLAAVIGALSALPKAISVLEDLHKRIRGLRDAVEKPPEPSSDMDEIKHMLMDIKDNMVTKTQLKSELDALEKRIQDKLDKKADK